MKTTLFLLPILCSQLLVPGLATTAQAQAVATPALSVPNGPVGDWKLVLNENFDGTGLDSKIWNTNLWFPGSINREQQFYQAENVQVANGKLIITAKKENAKTGWAEANQPQTLPYTSGMIQTRGKFETTYGAFEARVKLPKGKGFFPAFWLKAYPRPEASPPPEIDVMENLGHEPRIYQTYHHLIDGKPAHSSGNWLDQDFSSDFHTFTVEWTPRSIRWFIDGVERRQAFTNTAAICDKPMFVLLNLAIGSGWSGLPNTDTPFPQSLEADYIRVWQLPPGSPELQPVPKPATLPTLPAVAEKPWTEALSLQNLKAPRQILVDGQPFVPNGIYMGGEKCRDDNGNPGKIVKGACTPAGDVPAMWDLDRIAAAGFNTVLSYSNGAKGDAKTWAEHIASIREFLKRADQRHLKVIFSLKDLYFNKDGGWFLNDNNLNKTLSFFKTSPDWKGDGTPKPLDVAKAYIHEFKGHPALLAWNINDELSTNYIPELQAMYDTIKATDTDNPVMQLLYRLNDPSPLFDPRAYVSSTDILAADPYPIGLGRPFTLSTVSDWTRKLVAVADGKKAVWMVAQAYARNFDPPPNMSEVAPTLAEERNMSYQTLINGANGLMYWSLAAMQIEPAPLYNADGTVARHPTEIAVNHRGQITKDAYGQTVNRVLYEPIKNPDGTIKTAPNGRPVYPPNFGRRWPEMKAVAAEMKTLQPVLMNGQDVILPSVELPATLQRRAVKLGGTLYIMAVNTDFQAPASISWSLPASTNARERTVDASSTISAQLKSEGNTLTVTIPPLGSGFVQIRSF